MTNIDQIKRLIMEGASTSVQDRKVYDYDVKTLEAVGQDLGYDTDWSDEFNCYAVMGWTDATDKYCVEWLIYCKYYDSKEK